MCYFFFQVFVFLLSVLVTLQQALSSGYLNSVITTIEKRYEIPSSISGIIASMYEIGNLGTVIFVSYLGSRRHIPTWIGMGKNLKVISSAPFSFHNIKESNIRSNKAADIQPQNVLLVCTAKYKRADSVLFSSLFRWKIILRPGINQFIPSEKKGSLSFPSPRSGMLDLGCLFCVY